LTGLPLNIDITIRAESRKSGWCVGPSPYMTEYWQNSYDEGDATGIQLSGENPTVYGIDFSMAPAFIYYLPTVFLDGP
jgi:hypothetical protein